MGTTLLQRYFFMVRIQGNYPKKKPKSRLMNYVLPLTLLYIGATGWDQTHKDHISFFHMCCLIEKNDGFWGLFNIHGGRDSLHLVSYMFIHITLNNH